MKYKNCDVKLVWATYSDGGATALRLVDAGTGEPVATATVNLPERPLAPGEFFCKDYSEGAGMAAWLADNKIAEPTGRTVPSGYVTIPVMRWLCGPGAV